MSHEVLETCIKLLKAEIRDSIAQGKYKNVVQKATALLVMYTGARPSEASYAICNIKDTYGECGSILGIQDDKTDKAFTVPAKYTKTKSEYKFYLSPNDGGIFYDGILKDMKIATDKGFDWQTVSHSVNYTIAAFSARACKLLKHKTCECSQYNPKSVRRYRAT